MLGLALGAMAILMLGFSSCSTRVAFQSSSVVPAARGAVQIKKTDNNNYAIKVDVTNLAEPGRLTPPREVYVVWMESGNDPVKNLGKIETSSNLISKTLKASFETTSSNKPTRVFITAESEGNPSYPANMTVLTTSNF